MTNDYQLLAISMLIAQAISAPLAWKRAYRPAFAFGARGPALALGPVTAGINEGRSWANLSSFEIMFLLTASLVFALSLLGFVRPRVIPNIVFWISWLLNLYISALMTSLAFFFRLH